MADLTRKVRVGSNNAMSFLARSALLNIGLVPFAGLSQATTLGRDDRPAEYGPQKRARPAVLEIKISLQSIVSSRFSRSFKLPENIS